MMNLHGNFRKVVEVMTQIPGASQDATDRWFALALLIGIVVLGVVWFMFPGYPRSTRIAAIGGMLGLFGVIAVSLPVLRIGPYQWTTNLIWDIPADELRELEEQQKLDLFLQNVIGPYLVSVGTIVNGFSGFF
jgi:hypothetical protein